MPKASIKNSMSILDGASIYDLKLNPNLLIVNLDSDSIN